MWIITCDDRCYNADHFIEIVVENRNIIGYTTSGMATVISEHSDCYPIITDGIVKNKKYVVVD
jgi:hypothetical protein